MGDSYVSEKFEIEKDNNDDLLFTQDINVSESLLNEFLNQISFKSSNLIKLSK